MSKYYFFLFLIFMAVLYYVFLQDPCNILVKNDFSAQNPTYKIFDVGSSDGSVDSVKCHIYYEKPEDKEMHQDVWLYTNSGGDWSFARAIATDMREPEVTPDPGRIGR
ncbi:MAG: hypothetical protein GY727_13390 [Gammaproteobacteria bacterium]|nr:hypothetical protein [Gammaproteobacteria bacterium]MCP4088279.1 hypothetical protein [Gammaproteobacteria bacterium]MCP4276410.1 hypothetical protein [Gammaproteobacteria bacterium]MCP4831057.1 hypothetical protein [Gammaproteobacteria bacterium]MCP4927422.1 hypothetical protein [Gammaproteobacteria bacterium]